MKKMLIWQINEIIVEGALLIGRDMIPDILLVVLDFIHWDRSEYIIRIDVIMKRSDEI